MSFVRKIGEGIAWNTAGVITAKVVGFANIFLILSQLTVYEYGLTELVFSVISTIGLFLLPGLAATVTADLGLERVRKQPGKMKALFLEFFAMNIVLGIIAWAVLFFGSSVVAELSGNALIDKFFKIVSFSFLIAPFRGMTSMLATAMVRYADQSFIGPTEEVIKGLLLLFFFVVLERGADGLLWATVLAPVAVVILFASRTISAYREFSASTVEGWQPLWNILREHRKWNVASTYVSTLGQNFRIWCIKLLLGTEAVGLYAFAAGMYSHIASTANFQVALTPIVPRYVDRPGLLGRIITASIKYQLAFSALAFVGGCAAVYVLTSWVFPHYAPAFVLVCIMLIALIPHGVTANLTPIFVSFKEQRTLFFSMVVRVTSTIVLLPPALIMGGLTGVGIEFVLTMIVTSSERLYRVRKLLPEFALSFKAVTATDEVEVQRVKQALRKSGIRAFTQRFIGRG